MIVLNVYLWQAVLMYLENTQHIPKWEEGKVTLVCEQEEGAVFTEEEKKRQAEVKAEERIAKRPAYLENLK